jgi:uncharacterized protein
MMSLLLRAAIRVYQLTLAYFFVGACRYEPSCSRYAVEALQQHGALRGTWFAAHRFCRCGPWGAAGYDPVPPGRPTARTAAAATLSCQPAERS